jgi:hypothetical protein
MLLGFKLYEQQHVLEDKKPLVYPKTPSILHKATVQDEPIMTN